VVIPTDTGLLSADGLGRAVMERFAFRQVLEPLDVCFVTVPGMVRELEEEALTALAGEGIEPGRMEIRRRFAELRFAGQDSALEVEIGTAGLTAEPFLAKYEARYGHLPAGRQVELVSLKVVAASVAAAHERIPPAPARPGDQPRSAGSHRGSTLYLRSDLCPGQKLAGPALVLESHSVTVVDDGWECRVHGGGALILERQEGGGEQDGGVRKGTGAVQLELFTHRFETIAKEMGEQLRRTAVSTNIKERLDFSCALLDPDGELLVHAPHIPVHLGALGLCVRAVLGAMALEPGDVVVTNHPGYGGSHLPDITVITPVHAGGLIGYVASRAHHAELGGSRPGSMPPSASCLAEEGVVIPPMKLVDGGRPCWEAMEEILSGGRFPSRAVQDNLADLRAAVAANRAGGAALAGLADRSGRDTVLRYMQELKQLAANRLRTALAALPDDEYHAVERLDDGTKLAVTMTKMGDSAVLDFSGSGKVHPGNLNATPAIVHGAAIYFLRLLIQESIPLNEGFLHAVKLIIPEGILNPPFHDDPERSPAVVGGNVETSQRLVDTLVKALGLAACSQGTMNNVLFGTERFGYYETVCGGCGAGPGFHGASAVHSNMTNTRITDPEILEHRYPVRVERFGVRRGSGGGGEFRGGDGVVRILEFLAPMSLSVLTQHRVERPFGLNGGEPGMAGRQRVERADGTVLELKSVDETDLCEGDRFILETPGGGGYVHK
jgi:5-oxoprolinase (ATP-hydrolysing)